MGLGNRINDDSRKGAKDAKNKQKVKPEILNSKQIQMIKMHIIPDNLVSNFDPGFECFGLFHISSFGIRNLIRERLGAKNFVEVVLLNILSVRI